MSSGENTQGSGGAGTGSGSGSSSGAGTGTGNGGAGTGPGRRDVIWMVVGAGVVLLALGIVLRLTDAAPPVPWSAAVPLAGLCLYVAMSLLTPARRRTH